MKIFKRQLNLFLLQLTISLYLLEISFCLNPQKRKEILNYILGLQTSSLAQHLKDEEIYKPLTFISEESKLFQQYILATLEDNISADPNCIDYLLTVYKSSIFPTMKLIRDSSHSLSRLGSYQDCKYKIYYDRDNESISSKNISFNYILFYNPPEDVVKRPILFGLCVPNATDCSKQDYSMILETFNMKTDFIDTLNIAGIESYIINDSTKTWNNHYYIGIIVIAFCLIIFLFVFFPSIPSFLFKCCFKKKISKSKKSDSYKAASLMELEKSFDIRESISEIYTKGIGVGYDTGISFVKGLRGIFLFLFILGNTLEAVYQYPLQQNYNQYFNTNSLSFLFFFNRSSKSVFLSLSAFTLCFKILCFFDNEIERKELKNFNIKVDDLNTDALNNTLKEEEKSRRKNKQRIKKKKSLDNNSPNTSKSSGSPENTLNNTRKINLSQVSGISNSKINTSKSSAGDLSKLPSMSQINSVIAELKLKNKLSFKSFLIFFFRQTYKFILFIIVVLFYRYFYYDFISITTENPMWEFIKNSYINKLEPKYICSIIFLYFPFYVQANNDIKYDFFDIIILEFSLFILFSIVLFIFYKKNFRLDIFLLILFVIGLVIKITAYLVIFSPKINDEDTDVYEDYFYPSKGFTNTNYKLILNNPLYFISSISVGLFFGLVNYAIQKSAKNIKDFRDKLYLTIPIWLVKKLKKRAWLYSIIFFIVFIVYFIWSGLSYNALFLSEEKLKEDSKAIDFFENQGINIYYSVDVDIFVFILFLAIIPFLLIGENIISSFLEHDFWNLFSRPYFSFMLLVQTVGSNILYRMNTNVDNDISTIFFFTIINIVSSIIFGMLIYILLEVPLKKVNKFIFSRKEAEENIEGDNVMDDNENNQDSKIIEQEDKDEGDEDILLAAEI